MFVFPTAIAGSRHVAPRSLSRTIDHLFNDRYPAEPSIDPRVPALDVVESDTAYTLTLDMPGLGKDQLKVTVQARRVSIEAGAVGAPQAKAGERVLYRERPTPHYARTISLPAEVDQSSSSARFENGVLTLVLAKRTPTGATVLHID
ncbi:MAG: Hsp20/alpha crystallin family protein [Rhizobacter sp.]|nr:Hsp20/alpha crystallin family protein [Rhizobacter sp.]